VRPWRVRRSFLVLFVGMLLIVAGCSSEGAASGDAGVEVGTDTEQAPEIVLPEGDPPADLVVETVVEGDGDVVEAGDLLVVDYTGVLWDGGEQFDSSWERGEPAAFGIGVGQVIVGWDSGLVGQTVGSRVLLVIPPDQAYGSTGSGSVPPDATLVFAVDIRDSFSTADAVAGAEVTDLPSDLPEVSGEVGQRPTIVVTDTPEPEESTSIVLVEGAGEPLDGPTQVVAHGLGVSYATGEEVLSTWESAPEAIGVEGLPGLADALDGAAAGTRVLVLLSSADSGSGEPVAIVLDVLGAV